MSPHGGAWAERALAGASPTVPWLEDPARPSPGLPLAGPAAADLVVVGGGYLGLWTALRAVERHPGLDVLLLEAQTCGHAASGRNGGFVEASLTHGFGNGMARWPREMPQLLELGRANLAGFERDVAAYGIDCDLVRSGALAVATRPHQVEALREEREQMVALGEEVAWLESAEVRARVDSPVALAGYHAPDCALVEPARLAWGLRQACLDRGVRIAEGTRVTGVERSGAGVAVEVEGAGPVAARQVVLATNAYPSLLRRLRLMTVPVWDYALMTEPLTAEQRDAVGWWEGREGWSDAGNQFIYARTTRDGRILWGGYDAVYGYSSDRSRTREQRPETFRTLAELFHEAFPQLEDVGFGHAWGGMIDTCTRFAAFYGTALAGRVGYAQGFTGLGVGATRFAADVVLDLLAGERTERTELEMVRTTPLPFPPEPARYLGIEAMRRSLAAADDNGGRENLFLRTMGRLGLGFDS